MKDSYILEKIFRTLTGLKFDYVYVYHSIVCQQEKQKQLVRKDSFGNTVVYSIRQRLQKYRREIFH